MASTTHYAPLPGSNRRPAPGARRVGDEDPNARISVTILLRRRSDAPPLAQKRGASATDRHISRDEFAERYGAAPSEIELITKFATENGLHVEETSIPRRSVVVSGTVDQMNRAFHVNLGRYEAPNEHYRGREGDISLPEDVVSVVEGVFGLDDRTIGGRNTVTKSKAPRRNRSGGSLGVMQDLDGRLLGGANAGDPPNTAVTTPPEIAALYNFPTNAATGQTIGILEMGGGYHPADIQSFFNGLGAGFTTPTLTDVGIDGRTNSPGGNADVEVVLDICMAGAIAQGAQIAVYFAPSTQQGWVDALTRAVHPNAGDPVPTVLSLSWYISNGDDGTTLQNEGVTTAELNAVSAAFQDAAALGITVLVACGDTGSDSKIGDGIAHVQYPGSDPWITSCGGTTIGNINGSTFDEIVWNDDTGATGGGVSDFFAQPSYQNGAGVPLGVNDNHQGRGVPDIAGNASGNSGFSIFLNGSPIGAVGGTSAVSPLYAGLIAVINANLGRNVGFLNPLLYALNGSGVLRDIADGGDNALNGAPGYIAGGGYDAATGLGVLDGNALLAALKARFTKDCTIITDRSTFSKDEVEAMLLQAQPAVIDAAFYVTVDGFTPAEMGLTSATPTLAQLQAAAPAFTIAPQFPGLTIRPSALRAELPSLPAQPQRFTFVYQAVFANTSGFTAPMLPVQITATTHGVSGSALILLVLQPNPYMLDGPISWLSADVRVFQVRPGEALPGLGTSMAGSNPADASTFIKSVISGFNGLAPVNHPFDLISTDENSSQLELSEKVGGTPVFNYAVCRVRYRSLVVDATQVRGFFRLFPASTTATTYDPATTYRTGGANGVKIPVLGISAGELVTIPFFAETRISTNNTSMNEQTDPANDQTIQADGTGAERDAYFGCWLDINQLDPQFPINPAGDGPYGAGRQSIQQLIRGRHQCLVAEIAFDPQPIFPGVSPASSDKLSQRNLAIVESDNPGTLPSHRIPNTFDLKPTRPALPIGWTPDEIMIDWGNTPSDSEATIYLPGADVGEILDLSAQMYGGTPLKRVDDHTLRCPVGGATWLPVPAGEGPGFAGLMTIDLPPTVRRGQSFKVVVRQVTSGPIAKLPDQQPPRVNAPTRRTTKAVEGVAVEQQRQREQRKTLGAFQLSIPVRHKEAILPGEERAFSVLRWIQQAIPGSNRWHPVFTRYVGIIGDRVRALGGDPTHIRPSPDGSGVETEQHPGKHPGHRPEPGKHEEREERVGFTGKIDGLVYDRYGDFDGFVLDVDEGERRFRCRETEIERVVMQAWSTRVRVTVFVERDSKHRPESIVLHAPPPPLRR
jgi:hypothetical protein